MSDKIMGVYLIKNIDTDGEYVGSSVSVKDRINHHFHELKRNSHRNIKLQNSYNKHKGSFCWYLLEVVFDRDLLTKREQWWIDNLNPEYNIVRIACNTRKPLGRRLSDEHKNKLKSSWTKERRKEWSEIKKLLPSPNKGKKMPIGMGDKISKIHRPDDDPIILCSPDGHIHEIYNLCNFCNDNKLSRQMVRILLSNGTHKNLVGWSVVSKGWSKNSAYGKHKKSPRSTTVVVNDDINCVCELDNMLRFCRDNDLSYRQMNKLVHNEIKTYKGWSLCLA